MITMVAYLLCIFTLLACAKVMPSHPLILGLLLEALKKRYPPLNNLVNNLESSCLLK